MSGKRKFITVLMVCAAVMVVSVAHVAPAAAEISPTQFLPGDDAIGPAAGDQQAPAIAKGNDSSLAVWADGRALAGAGLFQEIETSRDIYGVRLDANGAVLDTTPIAITAAKSNQENPQVAWNGANWLVVFNTYSLGGTGYYQQGLAAVRVAPTGQVLDSQPILIYGVSATIGMWALAGDGNNWVVAFQGTPASNDLMALRISPDGVVLDPPVHSFVPATYYQRTNLHLAYAGGVFLLTFDDSYINGAFDTKAVRFDGNLNALDAAPFQLLTVPLSDLTSNGTEFYAVWNQQQDDYSMAVAGSRINTSGQKLDGNGVKISQKRQPQAYTATRVVWDGARWKVIWTSSNVAYGAAINASGQVINPGGAALAGLTTGPMAATSTGGLQVVWSTVADNNSDVFAANISPPNIVGPSQALSVGVPMQLRADVATNGNGYLLVYRSSTAGENRILAQPLDTNGAPLGGPVQLDTGNNVNGPGSPAVAWNGSLYMVAWGNANGIVAQRLNADGTKVDPAPFVVANPAFGSVDVEALGDTFLVVGLKFGYSVEIIFPIGVRVRGSDGAVLDPTPLTLGGSYSSKPKVVVLGGRWLAAWQQNATHDNPAASTLGMFIDADGAATTPFTIYGSYSTAGGNGIFDLGLASNGNVALMVQSAELSSGVETDALARIVNADGTLQPVTNLTPWTGNQYRPRAAWDGNQFVVVYQDQRNRLAEFGLDQLDARSDLFGMRLNATGAIIDPQGFLFSASPLAEGYPTVIGGNGVSLIAGSIVRNEAPYANYRIGYGRFGAGGNQWPVAVVAASPTGGDVPLTVNFSSAGSTDLDGSIASYAWDFGDGSASTEANPGHPYTTGGPFVATLTVTDNGGDSTTQTVLVKAVTPNQAPVAHGSALPPSGPTPLDVVFYAAGSYDPDGFIGNIQWDFGDGGDYWGAVAYHTFSAPGTYPVTLTVYDSQGATGTDTFTVQVLGPNQPPVAVASATPLSGDAPLTVAFSSAGSTDLDGTIAAYAWDFGDGATSAEANPGHVYQTGGLYNAILTVTDNQGATNTASVTLTVNPLPCLSYCMRSAKITLTAKGTTVLAVTGKVTVKDNSGALLPLTAVYATWTLPDGTTLYQTAVTNGLGVAKFTTSGGHGTYQLTVTNLTRPGYTFDPAHSVLSKSITK